MADSQKDINSLLQAAARYRRDASNALEADTKSLMKQKGLSEELARIEARKSETYKQNIASLKEINVQVNEIKTSNKENIGSLMSQEKGLKSLTGLQASFVDQERKKIKILADGGRMNDTTKDRLESIASLNQDLLETSREDAVTRDYLQRTIESELKGLKGLGVAATDLKNLEEEKFEKAKGVASMTQKQQKFLNKQLEVYEGIKDTIGGVLETASLLTSTLGGVMGIATIGAGKFLSKLGETRSQLGGISEVGTTALSFIDDNAVANATELGNQFGGIKNVSAELQASTSVISTNMGISGTEAASLLGDFSRLNDGSSETALNLVKSSQEFAKQNGIIPAALMADLAANTESFAEYGKQGGKNLIEAGTAARKMGVTLKTMTGISDNLLDFETSITAELELGAMLGKNINLDKARALAYAGKTTEATQETLKALGGIDGFNKMDIFSKRKTAQLLGISVSELSKMVSGQEEAAKLSGTMQEKFSLAGEAVSAGLNKYLGTTVQGLGGVLIATGQMGTGLKSIGGAAKGAFGMVSKLFKSKGGSQFAGGSFSKGKELLSASQNKIPETSVTEKITKTTGGKGMKIGSVLKGAAAILILSAALYVAAKAFQEFATVEWPDVALGISGLAALAGIAYILGKAKGQMLEGALAVAVLGAALIPFAYAMSLISGLEIGSVLAAAAGLVIFSAAVFGLGALMMTGVGAFIFGAGLAALAGLGLSMMILGGGLLVAAAGFQAIGGSMGSVISTISQVGTVIGGMFQHIAPIAALALALIGLAGALTLVGVAGLIALPGLMAIAAIGAVAIGVGSMLGLGGESGGASGGDDSLLTEIKGLRNDLISGKVGVYMDGTKVTAAIAKVVDKVGSNSYAI